MSSGASPRIALSCLAPVLLMLGTMTAAEAQRYTVTVLPVSGSPSPKGINSVGDLAIGRGPAAHGLLYSNGGFTDIPTFGGAYSLPRLINETRQVIGVSTDAAGKPYTFLWSEAGGLINLGFTFSGDTPSASAINNLGEVVGQAFGETSVPFRRAWYWSPSTGMVNLGTLGGFVSGASGINDSGQVVGNATNAAGQSRAFLWTSATGMEDLGSLGGNSLALAINNDGLVAGNSFLADGRQHVFLWTRAGGMLDITPTMQTCSVMALTSTGYVLGTCPGPFGGFLWTPATGKVDIAAPDGLYVVRAVNRDGVVVGNSLVNGQFRAFRYANGTIEDLNDLLVDAPPGTVVQFSHAISDSGLIAAGTASGALLLLNPQAPPGVTPPGEDVSVALTPTFGGTEIPVAIQFESVTGAGTTSVSVDVQGPAIPAGFKLGDPALYFDVATTATVSGNIRLCFSWTEGQFADETAVRLWHYATGAWQDVTDPSSLDTTANVACGNTTSLSPFVLVETAFQFAGFYRPVDNAPAFNTDKAGRAIPIKFSLGADYGLDVFAAGYPGSGPIACDSNAQAVSVLEAVSPGNSSLGYAGSGQYHYVWKTDGAWAGTCRQLVLRFRDGTDRRANFRFR